MPAQVDEGGGAILAKLVTRTAGAHRRRYLIRRDVRHPHGPTGCSAPRHGRRRWRVAEYLEQVVSEDSLGTAADLEVAMASMSPVTATNGP